MQFVYEFYFFVSFVVGCLLYLAWFLYILIVRAHVCVHPFMISRYKAEWIVRGAIHPEDPLISVNNHNAAAPGSFLFVVLYVHLVLFSSAVLLC